MSKGGQQSVSASVDPATQAYVEQLRKAALAAQGNPLYGQAQTAGGLGLSALTGDSTALGRLMNPYTETLNPIWNQLRSTTLQTIGDQATAAGAYGGSRQGVAEGQALADIANAQAGQRYQEYGGAMNRAAQLANLGFGVNPQRLALLQAGVGPYGTTQTQQTHSDLFSQLLGAGVTLAPLFA